MGTKQAWYYRKQTIVCVGGIAAAIVVLMVILSFSQGFQEFFSERILRMTPHLTLEAGRNEQITADLQGVIEDTVGVEGSSPYLVFPGLIQKGLAADPVTLKGVNWSDENRLFELERLLEAGDWNQIQENKGVVIGAELARMLGVRVGDGVTIVTPLHSAPLAVDGLFYTGYYPLDAGLVLLPLEMLQDLTETTGLTGYGVKVSNFSDVDSYILPLQSKTNLWVRPWYEREQSLFIGMSVQRTVLIWIMVFSLLVSALGIMNVFLLRAWEQQRNVGVLRTLGATPLEIGALFVTQGLYCGVLGGVLGAAAARLVVAVLRTLTIRLPQVFYMELLPISWAGKDVWWVVATAAAAGLGAVLWPAWRMTTIEPSEVMRNG